MAADPSFWRLPLSVSAPLEAIGRSGEEDAGTIHLHGPTPTAPFPPHLFKTASCSTLDIAVMVG